MFQLRFKSYQCNPSYTAPEVPDHRNYSLSLHPVPFYSVLVARGFHATTRDSNQVHKKASFVITPQLHLAPGKAPVRVRLIPTHSETVLVV